MSGSVKTAQGRIEPSAMPGNQRIFCPGVPDAAIYPALTGQMLLADGLHPVSGMLEFARDGANRPRLADLSWYLRQMIRWQQAKPDSTPNLQAIVQPALFERAALSAGLPFAIDPPKARLFDET